MKIILVAVSFLLISTLSFAQETLPWRPACNATATGPWKESFDSAGNQEFCYINSSVFYVQATLSRNFQGQLFKRSNPEMYIEGINYVQPVGPFKARDINITFDYYFPFYEDGAECPVSASNVNARTGFHNVPNLVLVGDNSANFASTTGSFNDAFMNFTLEASCGQWKTYSHLINDFENDFGSSFSSSNRDIGTFSFEAANMYVRNLRFIGAAGTMQLW